MNISNDCKKLCTPLYICNTIEKIYYEAGFRHIDTKQAGRASYAKGISKDL